jgi:hypothetical protein
LGPPETSASNGRRKDGHTLSFNIFRSLQEVGCVARVAEIEASGAVSAKRELFLWGWLVKRDGTTAFSLTADRLRRTAWRRR